MAQIQRSTIDCSVELEQRFRAINRAIKKGEKNGRYTAQQVSAHAQKVPVIKGESHRGEGRQAVGVKGRRAAE